MRSSGPALLDVNVLVSLTWPAQAAHDRCRKWFMSHAHEGWATCAITEAGFVRISSSEVNLPGRRTPAEAAATLAANLAHPNHEFWLCNLGFLDAIGPTRDRLRGPKQTTDAYLLGLAIHHDACLVTLDRGISSLLPAGSPLLRHLLLLA